MKTNAEYQREHRARVASRNQRAAKMEAALIRIEAKLAKSTRPDGIEIAALCRDALA